MKKVYPIIISILIIFTILIPSIFISTYDKSFYIQQFNKNNTYSNEMVVKRNINPEIIADEVIGYLKNDFSNLNRNGYFTKEEIIHMKDVKMLFTASKYILTIFLTLIIILIALYMKVIGTFYILLNKIRKYFIIITIGLSTLLFIAFKNFSESFIVFHEMFFRNDYWLLDLDTSIIINIMPEEFFLAHAVNIGKLFLIFSFIFIISTLFISKYMKKKLKEDI